MVLISRAPIEFRRGFISAIDFQMDGIHAHLACLLFEEGDGMPAKAAASVSGVDVQFVNKSVMAMELKAETYR